MESRHIRFSLHYAFLGFLLLAAGCASLPTNQVSINGEEAVPLESKIHIDPFYLDPDLIRAQDQLSIAIQPILDGESGTRLEIFDTLEFAFNFSATSTEYRVLIGDELMITHPTNDELNKELVVRPDGKITLFQNLEVSAAGFTPREIAENAKQILQDRLSNPEVAVEVMKINREFVEIEGSASIQPDGNCFVPHIGIIQVKGLTLSEASNLFASKAYDVFKNSFFVELHRERSDSATSILENLAEVIKVTDEFQINIPEFGLLDIRGDTVDSLQSKIQNLIDLRFSNAYQVSVERLASSDQIVYVDGEVGLPGPVSVDSGMTMLQSIVKAGGALETADLSVATLIRRDSQQDVYVYVSDLKEFISEGIPERDLLVKSGDIILLPKTRIAKLNQWVSQYITQVLPFSRNVSYTYTRTPTNPTIDTSGVNNQ